LHGRREGRGKGKNLRKEPTTGTNNRSASSGKEEPKEVGHREREPKNQSYEARNKDSSTSDYSILEAKIRGKIKEHKRMEENYSVVSANLGEWDPPTPQI